MVTKSTEGGTRSAFQGRSSTQLLAVLLALGPAYLIALFNHLTRDSAFSLGFHSSVITAMGAILVTRRAGR